MKVCEQIDIAARPEHVFAFFDDVANASVLQPRIVEITSVDALPAGGRRVEYTLHSESGEPTPASSEHVEHDPPHRTVARGVQSGISTTATREFSAIPGGTRVTATVAYDVPIRYLGRLLTAPLRGPLRRSLRESLAAAKAALESTP